MSTNLNSTPNQQVAKTAVLRVEINETKNATTYDLIKDTGMIVTAIDNLFTQLALIESPGLASEYANRVSQYSRAMEKSLLAADIYPTQSVREHFLLRLNLNKLVLEREKMPLLQISSITYGSPITIDFLGVGKILEFIEHAIKQLWWQGKHEQELAKRERAKAFLEQQLLLESVAKARVETETKELETLSKKIALIREIQLLDIPRDKKKILVNNLLREVEQLSVLPNLESVNLVDS